MTIGIMLDMGRAVSIDLTPLEATTLRKPIRGRGGFQSLRRKLQRQLVGRRLEVCSPDRERLRRYAVAYGAGGFQRRTKGAIP